MAPCAARFIARGTLAVLVAASAVHVQAATPEVAGHDDIRGLWVDHRDSDKYKVAVWIEDCDGLLCGRIYWMKKPQSGGAPKRDQHNPETALRERPLCGLRILTGFRKTKEAGWGSGHIYNPNDGRTFSSTIALQPDGSLRIRGFVGVALLGKTVEWVRPPEPLPRCG